MAKVLQDYQNLLEPFGFIAQEVEATARSLGYDFSGIDSPSAMDGPTRTNQYAPGSH